MNNIGQFSEKETEANFYKELCFDLIDEIYLVSSKLEKAVALSQMFINYYDFCDREPNKSAIMILHLTGKPLQTLCMQLPILH